MSKKQLIFRQSCITLFILLITTALAFVMRSYSVRTENILLIYIGAVLFINIETKNLWIALVSVLICIIIFNFFFIEPYFTFIIADPNYWISIIIFCLVTLVVNTLTSSLQKQVQLSAQSEQRNELLNNINISLMNAHEYSNIIQIMYESLSIYLKRETLLFVRTEDKEILYPDSIEIDLHIEKVNWCIKHQTTCGNNCLVFPDSKFLYIPLKMSQKTGISGVFALKVDDKSLSKSDSLFLDAALASMIIACDRKTTSVQKEKATLQIEKEKFKSALLRSISHDIRTPLTSICTGSSILIDSYDDIPSDERKKILSDINSESMYLAEFVTNLLNMTKIEANRLVVEKQKELVDDILTEVYQRVKRHLGDHLLKLPKNDSLLFVDADRQLLVQVLVNLVGNAIIHTKDNSIVRIEYACSNNEIEFSVIDNGGGIDPKRLDTLFDEPTLIKPGRGDKFRGSGLGLSISKAIVQAHGGKISVKNNDENGSTFTFTLPYEEEGV
ncbi:MAG: ATP-binding protein [Candidatus Izemoplasmatales bacterium]